MAKQCSRILELTARTRGEASQSEEIHNDLTPPVVEYLDQEVLEKNGEGFRLHTTVLLTIKRFHLWFNCKRLVRMDLESNMTLRKPVLYALNMSARNWQLEDDPGYITEWT